MNLTAFDFAILLDALRGASFPASHSYGSEGGRLSTCKFQYREEERKTVLAKIEKQLTEKQFSVAVGEPVAQSNYWTTR